jgi:hypothetical protein
MDKNKEKEPPVGVLKTWLIRVAGSTTCKIQANSQVQSMLSKLCTWGGYGRFSDIRHCDGHAREIQKGLVLGLIKRTPKDCAICPGRQGNKAVCLLYDRRCAARYLYRITNHGLMALEVLRKTHPKDKRYYEIQVNIDPTWWQYFLMHIW